MRLEAVDLSFSGNQQFSLRDICFTLWAGEFVIWVGPNGSGKSSLLKTLLGWIRPRRGEVWRRDPPPRCGYVPQSSRADISWPLTVGELLDLTADLLRPPSLFRRSSKAAVDQALDRVGILALKGHLIGNLSGGELQRVLLARTLLMKPEVLLLDEPTASMDVLASAAFMRLVKRLQREDGLTVLMITHDFQLVDQGVDRVGVLARERLHCGRADELLTDAGLSRAFGAPVRVVWSEGRLRVDALGPAKEEGEDR